MASANCGGDDATASVAVGNATQLPGGLQFDPCDPLVVMWYSLANIVVTSVVPVPLAGPMTAVAAILFGLFLGMVINVLSSVVGAYIGLLCIRHLCRPCFMRALGRYHKHWLALDAALSEQGSQIALLIRIAPISPMVATNILLSLTSISTPTYLWTCAIGIIPSNLPYAYAAQLGVSLASEFPPQDPVMLTMTVLGLVASIAIAWKLGNIAKRLLQQHGVGGKEPAEPDGPLPPAAHADELQAHDGAAAPGGVAVGAAAQQAVGGGAVGGAAATEADLELQPLPPAADDAYVDHDRRANGAPAGALPGRGCKKPATSCGRARKQGTGGKFVPLEEDDGL
mmetsp:Transcript_19033/g.48726  ORF Transcript_19033/g.48726 Transcript_19033/m.48726 type:complete len:340 (-) Transcript_19033:186-1205(-)